MEQLPNCPKCASTLTYSDVSSYICPECGHEWPHHSEAKEEQQALIVKDAHGNLLKDGDSVTIIKDIKVKGSSSPIKVGTKVKDILLIPEENGHNIDAKVPGFGAMLLKSEFVKKSS